MKLFSSWFCGSARLGCLGGTAYLCEAWLISAVVHSCSVLLWAEGLSSPSHGLVSSRIAWASSLGSQLPRAASRYTSMYTSFYDSACITSAMSQASKRSQVAKPRGSVRGQCQRPCTEEGWAHGAVTAVSPRQLVFLKLDNKHQKTLFLL